jgi:hypothetical protein
MKLLVSFLLPFLPLSLSSQHDLSPHISPPSNSNTHSLSQRSESDHPSHSPESLKILESLSFNSPVPSLSVPTSSPQSYLLSHVVIVVTVDGGLHALDRQSGRWLWSLNQDTGSVDRTDLGNFKRKRKSSPSSETVGINKRKPVVRSKNWILEEIKSRKTRNSTSSSFSSG